MSDLQRQDQPAGVSWTCCVDEHRHTTKEGAAECCRNHCPFCGSHLGDEHWSNRRLQLLEEIRVMKGLIEHGLLPTQFEWLGKEAEMPKETTEYWTRWSVRKGVPYVHLHYHAIDILIPSDVFRKLAIEGVGDSDKAEEHANLHPGKDVPPAPPPE